MPKIRVMFSSRPRLLSEVIRNFINTQADMTVVGEVIDPIELIFALRLKAVDVVIISPQAANGPPRICSQLLKEHQQLTIIILTPKSETAWLYKAGLQRKKIEGPTQQKIIDAIRQSALPAAG